MCPTTSAACSATITSCRWLRDVIFEPDTLGIFVLAAWVWMIASGVVLFTAARRQRA